MHIKRRHLHVALGVLWLFDGMLQLQPFMFTTGFAHQILAPSADGQPEWVAGPVRLAADQFASHPVVLNAVAAAVQLALGVGFLMRRTVRLAVVGSVVWAVSIWCVGEGLGGLASGHANLITGAPGAAVLYAVLAAASWPRTKRARDDSEHAADESATWSETPAQWVGWAWALLWVGAAVLQLLPPQLDAAGLADDIRGGSDGAPVWLAAIDRAVADAVGHGGTGPLVALAVVEAAIGVGVLFRERVRVLATYSGAVLAAAFWLVGQNLGQLYTGRATDPNTALLLIVLAATTAAISPRVIGAPRLRATSERHLRPQRTKTATAAPYEETVS